MGRMSRLGDRPCPVMRARAVSQHHRAAWLVREDGQNLAPADSSMERRCSGGSRISRMKRGRRRRIHADDPHLFHGRLPDDGRSTPATLARRCRRGASPRLLRGRLHRRARPCPSGVRAARHASSQLPGSAARGADASGHGRRTCEPSASCKQGTGIPAGPSRPFTGLPPCIVLSTTAPRPRLTARGSSTSRSSRCGRFIGRRARTRQRGSFGLPATPAAGRQPSCTTCEVRFPAPPFRPSVPPRWGRFKATRCPPWRGRRHVPDRSLPG